MEAKRSLWKRPPPLRWRIALGLLALTVGLIWFFWFIVMPLLLLLWSWYMSTDAFAAGLNENAAILSRGSWAVFECIVGHFPGYEEVSVGRILAAAWSPIRGALTVG